MFALLPALVSMLFLGFGGYVLLSRGASQASLTFLLMCAATFFWQFCWAALFRIENAEAALVLAKLGYLIILLLPTTLYHFAVASTGAPDERRWLLASYCAALALGVLLLSGDAIVAGLYRYEFGFYPRAGAWHWLHLAQTTLVMVRALALLYREQAKAADERIRLRYCLASLAIYCLASVDYLVNYGLALYPPGVLFVTISLGLIARAVTRHQLLGHPMLIAATIAHEMRTPLATVRAQARVLARHMPELLAAYEQSGQGARGDTGAAALGPARLAYLQGLASEIDTEMVRAGFVVDMMLASTRVDTFSNERFALHSVQKCVDQALASYPFDGAARARVAVRATADFTFFGSDVLLMYVLYNLFRNALQAMAAAGRGTLEIAFYADEWRNQLVVTDTGPGIPGHVLPHVFDPFFSTRQAGAGTGMGLAFCRRVLTAFGGRIECESMEGLYTSFRLEFPPAAHAQLASGRG